MGEPPSPGNSVYDGAHGTCDATGGASLACEATFNSPCFLFAFLPLFLVAYWGGAWALLRLGGTGKRWRLGLIVVGGFVFYSFWDARFAVLLFVAALADYAIALGLARSSRKRAWLAGSVAFNLALLAIFKYAVFAADSARSVFDLLGVPVEVPYFSVALPIGISFYTFKTMSYTIDVYRGEIPATRDFLKYLAFICLFVDLVAGPILRFRDLSGQLDGLPRRLDGDAASTGLATFFVGLFKKAIVADMLATQVDSIWGAPDGFNTPRAWIGVVGFGLQLYFDFSGYSDMAVGLGQLLGLRIPQNFNAPYQALNPSDFWRRWHMTLSSWLRDYLYIPLGGSHRGEGRVAMNLMVVMVLGGLWHGAAWTFVLWGALHGAALVGYHRAKRTWDAAPRLAQRGAMLFIVFNGWVLFRAPDLGAALQMYHVMFVPTGAEWYLAVRALGFRFLIVFALALVAVLGTRPLAQRLPRNPTARAAVAAALAAIAFLGVGQDDSPFLYYQF